MSRFLALDGDTNLLQVLSANVKGDTVRLERSLAWEEEQSVNLTNAAAIGGRLRDQLKSAGVAAAPLLVCVGRDRVVLKEIRIPSVPEHEEPAIVRFQAMKEFTDGGDEVVLDYVPLGPATAEGRRIQVMSVRKDVLKAFRALAEAAGLKVAALTPRPFALLAGLKQAIRTGLAPAPEPADAPIGLLVRGPKWGEFTIARNGFLGMTRSIAGPALSSDQAILGEIRRNLALYASQNQDTPVRTLYLAEPDSPGGLRDRLQDSLSIPVHAYEPLVGIPAPDGPQGTFAGLAGLFAQQASSESTINFAQPREPRPPRDPNKRLLAICAVAALLLIAAFGGYSYLKVSSMKAEVDRIRIKLDTANSDLRKLEPDEKRIKALDAWTATNINWLDELYDMTARMPDTKTLRLISIQMNTREDHAPTTTVAVPPGPNSANKKETAGTMTIRGIYSSESFSFTRFKGELSEPNAFFELNAPSVKPNRVLDPTHFDMEFTTKIDLARRPRDKYTRTFTAKSLSRFGADVAGDEGVAAENLERKSAVQAENGGSREGGSR